MRPEVQTVGRTWRELRRYVMGRHPGGETQPGGLQGIDGRRTQLVPNPSKSCSRNGLHFCEIKKVPESPLALLRILHHSAQPSGRSPPVRALCGPVLPLSGHWTLVHSAGQAFVWAPVAAGARAGPQPSTEQSLASHSNPTRCGRPRQTAASPNLHFTGEEAEE